MKELRYRFYEILERHGVVKTRLGRIVDADNVVSLRRELMEWRREYLSIQKDIDLFIKNPLAFKGGDLVLGQIRKHHLHWPPKDFNITDRFFLEIIGPIKIPKKLYDQLILKAITNTEER